MYIIINYLLYKCGFFRIQKWDSAHLFIEWNWYSHCLASIEMAAIQSSEEIQCLQKQQEHAYSHSLGMRMKAMDPIDFDVIVSHRLFLLFHRFACVCVVCLSHCDWDWLCAPRLLSSHQKQSYTLPFRVTSERLKRIVNESTKRE